MRTNLERGLERKGEQMRENERMIHKPRERIENEYEKSLS